MTHWWDHRRFGLLFQANLAAVPAWAPIGQWSDWYRAHLDDDVSNTLLQSAPLAETLAHHRDRWSHIERYDDFLPFLTFDEFDADELVSLVRDAGMSYLVAMAKHHDGWCWWDAPNTERILTRCGPRRNVISELATACERGDTVLGASYSLLDWGDRRHPSIEYVTKVMHPHIIDLAERYGVQLLRGEGHWAAGGDHWRSDELIDELVRLVPDLVVNDRFWSTRPAMQTIEFEIPDDAITDRRWELTRGLGPSYAHNRAEPADRLMTSAAVVEMLTEVIAKGGHLLLAVGPTASGTVPESHAAVLREAGTWVAQHDRLVNESTPWTHWGDDVARYLQLDGQLQAIDVAGCGVFAHLAAAEHPVTAVLDADQRRVGFRQTERGLELELTRPPRRSNRPTMPTVYHIELAPSAAPPVALFPVERTSAAALSDALAGSRSGDLVQLGEGRYVGPALIPDGVTVRGLGSHRTTIDGGASESIVLGAGSRIEHCRLIGGGERIAWLPRNAVRVRGDRASMLACEVAGHVMIDAADQVKLSSCELTGIVAEQCERLTVVRCTFVGMGWDCAIDVQGGAGHLIESCDASKALQAIRFTGTVDSTVRNSTLSARWWAVQLIDTESTVVTANAIERSMRAVDVDGGVGNVVTGNAVFDGDSGCVVQRGAVDTEVAGNHWERCRVGYFAWDTGPTRLHSNAAVDLFEAPEIIGP